MYHKNEYPSIAALCAAFLAGSDLYPDFFLQCGMDFRRGEDPDDFKNTFDHFDGQNHQFSHYYSILASK